MPDYGLAVVNNYGSLVIDNDHKVMVFSERGTFRIESRYSDREGYGTVSFIRGIHTNEPPQVFLRHVSGVHTSLGVYITLLGGPGHWTGFAVTSAVRGGALQNYVMEFVVCKFADQPSSEPFGLNLFDGYGRPVFSSQDKIVRYHKFAKHWEKIVGAQVDVYASNLVIDADDFVCASAIDRGITWFADGANFVGLILLEDNIPSLKISAQKTGGGYWYYQGTNDTCFGIPVCKFPPNRYYN